jgi:hypothetical protein
VTYETSDMINSMRMTVLFWYVFWKPGVDPYNYSITATMRQLFKWRDCYNREIIPQSVFSSASPMVSDAHFLLQLMEK